MKLKLYQVDSFTETLFKGNPAGVLLTKTWLSDELMQKIANENNLSETAFVVKNNDKYEIRWFTPNLEVDLCGHATLASAYVIFDILKLETSKIKFYSPKSGELQVSKLEDGFLQMNFPTDEVTEVVNTPIFENAIGFKPEMVLKGKTDYLLIFDNQSIIEKITPNFNLVNQIEARGIIVSSIGDKVDFVSRFFAPQCGINEDPVTGSAHTTLIPFWGNVLGKDKLTAKQISQREGFLKCEYLGNRVNIAGKAVLYMIADILTD